MEKADLEFAHGMSFDPKDPQCGRVVPLEGDLMGNLTARGTHLRYVVFRYGDPLVHVPGSSSSRTACGWSVTNYDRVDVADDVAVTCVQCAVVDILRLARGDEAEIYGRALADAYARDLARLGIK